MVTRKDRSRAFPALLILLSLAVCGCDGFTKYDLDVACNPASPGLFENELLVGASDDDTTRYLICYSLPGFTIQCSRPTVQKVIEGLTDTYYCTTVDHKSVRVRVTYRPSS